MPESWVNEDNYVRLCVAKGTLVPAKTLRCGHPQAPTPIPPLTHPLTTRRPPTPNPSQPPDPPQAPDNPQPRAATYCTT